MDIGARTATLINLLCKGESQTRHSRDDFVAEFEKSNLIAGVVSVLEFKLHDIDKLARRLEDLNDRAGRAGLVITSPRVVTALAAALEMFSLEKRFKIISSLDSDLVFTVGEKSGEECKSKLGLNYNVRSASSGDATNLAIFMKTAIRDDQQAEPIRLIYPKGSRADDHVERAFQGMKNVQVSAIEVYDTYSVDHLDTSILECLERLDVSRDIPKLVLNLIFFSPSGLESFTKMNGAELMRKLGLSYPLCHIDLKYSSIGRTTAAALTRANLELFCVADKPTASSLVSAILSSM